MATLPVTPTTSEVRHSRETDHIMVKAELPSGEYTWLDEAIAPLIIALWERGFTTDYSCQGGEKQPGGTSKAYISFATWSEGVRFMFQTHERFKAAQCNWSKTKRFYVHTGLLELEISDPDHDGSDGPRSCVRFHPTSGEYDVLSELTALWSEHHGP